MKPRTKRKRSKSAPVAQMAAIQTPRFLVIELIGGLELGGEGLVARAGLRESLLGGGEVSLARRVAGGAIEGVLETGFSIAEFMAESAPDVGLDSLLSAVVLIDTKPMPWAVTNKLSRGLETVSTSAIMSIPCCSGNDFRRASSAASSPSVPTKKEVANTLNQRTPVLDMNEATCIWMPL
jgi:hypothetical protein